jgi:hypothetical protein
MKLDPGMHIGLHLVFFGKSGVTLFDLDQRGGETAEAGDQQVGTMRRARDNLVGSTAGSLPYGRP